jgi:DNA-binding CsgD family transcriptional regulator/tetratricopeptide (TPR) repeat protein
VRFAHALVREALYEAVPPPRRRRMHQRIADAVMQRSRPDPDVVAYHFRQAGDARAAPWLVRAGERARAAYAYETAVARFEEALPLLEADAALDRTRAEVLLILACLLRLEGADPLQGVRYAQAATELATELGDDVFAAVARFRLGTNLCLALRSSEGLTAMREVVALLDGLPADAADHLMHLDPRSASPWQRQAEYALRLAIVGRFSEAEPQAVAARLEGLRRHDINYNASNALTHVYPAQGRTAEARAMFAECHTQTTTVEEYYHAVLSLVYEIARVVIPYCADQLPYREQVALRAAAWCKQTTGAFAGLPLSAALHGLFYLDGRWDDVVAATYGSYGMQQEHAWVTGRIALARGELQAAGHIIRPFLPDSPATAPGDAWFLGTTAGQRLAAALALAAGDVPTTRAWLESHDRWLDWGAAVLGRADGALLWSRLHCAAGDMEQARASAERSLALAGEPRQPLAVLAAERLLGELDTAAGRYADAEGHVRAALTIADGCRAPYERALTLLALADVRRLTGDHAQASAILTEARGLCIPLRASPALTRIDALAVCLPARPMIDAPRAGLTAREIEVLRLVVEGLSDREIAQRLSIGSRTVQTHVTSILAKFGVSSRTAAATHAVRHGIV